MRNRAILIALGIIALIVVGRLFFPGPAPHVSLKAEPVLHLGGLAIENTTVAAWASIAVILLVFWRASRTASLIPSGRSWQNALEIVLDMFLNLCNNVAGPRNAPPLFSPVRPLFPLHLLQQLSWLVARLPPDRLARERRARLRMEQVH